MGYNFDLGILQPKQQTSVGLLLSKIPDAAEIKAFISENDADEKMLDEWLWERIYKGVDYKQMHREEIEKANIAGMEFIPVDPNRYQSDASDYYNQTYGQ